MRKFGTTADVSVLGGIAKPNWGRWMHNASETLDRKFYGLRASKRFEEDAAIGTSLVWLQDSRARFNTTAVAQDQRLASLDWNLPTFHKLRLYGNRLFQSRKTTTRSRPPTANGAGRTRSGPITPCGDSGRKTNSSA